MEALLLAFHGERSDMSKQSWIFHGIICVFFGAAIALLVSKLIEERPERELARLFLLSNSVVLERFGDPITVAGASTGASVAFHADKTTGRFRYFVDGAKTSGWVRVQWMNSADHGFRVDGIDLLNSPEKPIGLWPEAESTRTP